MAQNYYKTAANRLNPAYNTQADAIKSELPAIAKLYQILNQSLMGQNQVAQQNNLESASARGVLKSTIPVDALAGLEQALIGQQAQLGAEQAKEVAGVNTRLGQIGIDRTNAISTLANALYGNNLSMQQFKWDKKLGKMNLAYQKRLGNQQYNIQKRQLSQGIG